MKYLLLVFALIGAPALAQLTPQALVENWQASHSQLGEVMTIAEQAQVGDTLTLRDVVIIQNDESSSDTTTFDWIALQALPDGRIRVTAAPDVGWVSTGNILSNNFANFEGTFSFTGYSLLVSGTPEAIRYDISASSYGFSGSYSEMIDEGPIGFSASDITATVTTLTAPDGGREINAELSVGSLTAKKINDYGGEMSFTQNARLEAQDISGQFRLVMEPEITIVNGYPKGMSLDATLTSGPLLVRHVTESSGSDSVIELSLGGTSLHFGFGADAMFLSASLQSALLKGTPDGIEFETYLAEMPEMQFGLFYPISASPSPQDFNLSTRLSGLALSPEAWGKIDPEANFSQTPASLELDLSGQVTLSQDLYEGWGYEAREEGVAALQSLTLNALEVGAEGMALSGSGGVVFGQDQMFEGIGMGTPNGALDFSITGALALLDKIGQIPGIDPMIALGAKGALGAFATPGDAPDSFTSQIEFTADGGISINGQQVR